ncbi:MAG TPA: putative sulfate exporter family transporter [Mycobacteriales bacterium]|nr:putative sulfate exporter family transporter [Mycobacteriales bacterium]
MTALAVAIRGRSWRGALPGLAVVAAIAGLATAFGRFAPLVGGPIFGILLGACAGAALRAATPDRIGLLQPGIATASKQLLQLSIVVLGTGLSLRQVAHTGVSSLPVMLATLVVALGGARIAGRVLGVHSDAQTLIGVGTGICGASAIAATTAVIRAAEADVAYAVATIFTFNIAAVLLFPALGHALGLSQHAFGLWSGTAINDTSSVVAASTIYGDAARSYGVVVKLTRSLMIIPICLALGALTARRAARSGMPGTAAGSARLPWRRMVPAFLIGFLVASALDTVGVIPAGWHPALTDTSVFLITMALTGIGLSTRPRALRAAGPRPLLLGGILWVSVGITSLLLQLATGNI